MSDMSQVLYLINYFTLSWPITFDSMAANSKAHSLAQNQNKKRKKTNTRVDGKTSRVEKGEKVEKVVRVKVKARSRNVSRRRQIDLLLHTAFSPNIHTPAMTTTSAENGASRERQRVSSFRNSKALVRYRQPMNNHKAKSSNASKKVVLSKFCNILCPMQQAFHVDSQQQ